MANSIDAVRKKVRETMATYDMLKDVRHIVLGFSGGPDSICLFDVLEDMSREYGFRLYAVHVNHGIREGASDEEERFCDEFCRDRGVEFTGFSYDCQEEAAKWGVSTEEAGRRLRYRSFYTAAEKICMEEVMRSEDKSTESIAVAVAHNSDDQVETVIMRILRGTGTDGLSGIPYIRKYYGDSANLNSVNIIRPLLDVSREEILEYCREQGLDPRMDKTNEEPIYRRNEIRLNLIPELEKYNPNIKNAILRLSNSAAEDRDFLEKSAEGALASSVIETAEDEAVLNVEVLRIMHPSLRRRAINKILSDLGLDSDVGSEHYTALDKIIFTGSPSASINLPRGYYAKRRYDRLILGRSGGSESCFDEEQGHKSRTAHIFFSEMTVEEYNTKAKDDVGSKYVAFDRDELVNVFGKDVFDKIQVRNRLAGDVIKLSAGTKKIQDLMVDDKIPREERSLATVVAVGNRVLWMIPRKDGKTRLTSECGVSENTKNVFLAEKLCD